MPGRQFRTFYAIEALNYGTNRLVAGRGKDLDIAFLGTVALQQAGLPLDEIFATRASLLEQCGESYFASSSERKRRFHRTLVDLGVIERSARRALSILMQASLAVIPGRASARTRNLEIPRFELTRAPE